MSLERHQLQNAFQVASFMRLVESCLDGPDDCWEWTPQGHGVLLRHQVVSLIHWGSECEKDPCVSDEA